jgi:hypothetical protein
MVVNPMKQFLDQKGVGIVCAAMMKFDEIERRQMPSQESEQPAPQIKTSVAAEPAAIYRGIGES